MINKQDILDLLASGKSIDDIASAMSDALNEAKEEHDEIVARETEELKRLSAESEAKREAMRAVVGTMVDYAANFTDLLDQLDEEDKEDLLNPTDEIIDSIVETVEELGEMAKLYFGLMKLQEKKEKCGKGEYKPVSVKLKTQSTDDVINSFLKDMGW